MNRLLGPMLMMILVGRSDSASDASAIQSMLSDRVANSVGN